MSTKRVVVRYKVKPERVEEHERLIRDVFAELAERRPSGLAYQALKLEDGVSFLHVADVSTADGRSPLVEFAAFKAFTANIADRCDERPLAMTVTTSSTFP